MTLVQAAQIRAGAICSAVEHAGSSIMEPTGRNRWQ
jgi:hypothetical protein